MQSRAERFQNPLNLAMVLSDWADHREKGAQLFDRDAALARHMALEALTLDAQRLELASPLFLARWKVSWLALAQRADSLLTARPSRRPRLSRRPCAWSNGLLAPGRSPDVRPARAA